AYVIVSHDRYFLETVATKIWELDAGELTEYAVSPGTAYTRYVAQREERRAQKQRDYEAALSERERQSAVIAELRTHGSHNYSHVRSREKALERVTEIEGPRKERRTISVALTAARRATSGIAIELADVAKAYKEQLFSDVSAKFARGESI